ncbi:hypothetical protein CHRY9390_01626 [Chryseobacterium aquaeductus]|uniref:DUF6443 domain-containing protein n=1 Tax=Chryseobacterium aquaeductus TaxID=2675056 RepID=A0A9N8MGX0_9FLAO|nr:DUF6443 domain-containing protein [Chryseobacterium aquaeductus]CAA7330947.1 hypothetical protein CHRY9390_01626 [Chryseobacterium potabilaquae]CAD7807207.1 hypothetical protein CHRY9390_01626 [Chryseobacterium aquaeductus]
MKKILIPISAIFIAGFSQAQLTNTENYVQTRVYLEPVTTSSSTAKQVQTVQYIDGLGRPKQVVNVKASPTGKDVVSHIEYDGFGRQVKDFLPVPQSGTMNGAIVPNPLANATQPTLYGSEKIYSEKILENSPLDRVFEQKQVGNSWSNKPVKFEYDANSVADAVKKYTTTTTWVSGATNSVLTQTANYGLAQLYKNTVIDEDGNKTIEFKNGEGQTVLVRKMLDGTNSADTYYVYNEYNQLAYVIPPLAVAANSINETTLINLCYQYKYDGRNRLVEKKLPGKGWEYMVYDKQDRLVATQDANLASNGQWLFTKYDKFGRVIYTGLAELGSRNSAQTNLDNLSGTAAPNNEAKSTSSFNHSGMDIYYSNSAFPTNIIKILSVNYYDTYPTGSPAIPTQVLGQNVLPQDAQNSNISTKSLPVASYVKNIEDDNWTKNYTWYDTKGRAIGSHSINHLGGFTKTESELDFAGVVKKTNTYHSRSSQSTEVTVKENFTYDPQNRLVTHTHQVNGNPVEILAENTYNELGQLIYKNIGGGLQSAEYDYNIRGWMTGINKNNLSPNGMGSKLFAYDIRYENPTESGISHTKFNGNISEVNWMVSSNQTHKRYVYNYDKLNRLTAAIFLNPNSTTPLNHMNDEIVDYDLNGNITYLMRNAAPFAGTTPDMIDDLIYTYNGNQLLQIQDDSNNPTGYEGGGGWIDYDANGNMLNMPDKQINQIGYNFLNLPNALKIEDSKKKLFHLYRADGSKLKKIFNYLKDDGNNFTTVTEYLDGFQYLTTMGTKPNDIDPMEFAYEQEAFLEQILEEKPTTALQFFPTAEGFYDYENNQYIYQYKDHLGNARVSYKKGVNGLAEITDQNDYYPFGMNIPREEKAIFGVASLYNYKYNGKELQETGMYDYGARFYMPDIGRWGVVDPLAEKMTRHSPFNYAFNNPIMFIDPDGREGEDWFTNRFDQMEFRDDIKSQQDLDDKGIQGSYVGASDKQGDTTYAADGYVYDDSANGGGTPIANGRVTDIEGVTIYSSGAIAQRNINAARERLGAAEAAMFGKYAMGFSVGYSLNNISYDLSLAFNFGTGQARIFGTNSLTTGSSNGVNLKLFQMNAYGKNADGSAYTNVFEGATGSSAEVSGAVGLGGAKAWSIDSKTGARSPLGTVMRSINLGVNYDVGASVGDTKDLTPAFNRLSNPKF